MTAVLNRPVLVLNRGWKAIDVIPVKDAITLVYSTYNDGTPKARILDASNDFSLFTWQDWSELKAKEGEAVIRGNSSDYRVPEIILLGSKYVKLPEQRNNFCRKRIFQRDNYICMYCGKKGDLSIDHVLPRCKGGKTEWTNVVLACTSCNRKKADKTMEQVGFKFFIPGYKPHKPKFRLYTGEIKYKSWTNFMDMDTCYWNIELENDM